jgi:hypothetical protein
MLPEGWRPIRSEDAATVAAHRRGRGLRRLSLAPGVAGRSRHLGAYQPRARLVAPRGGRTRGRRGRGRAACSRARHLREASFVFLRVLARKMPQLRRTSSPPRSLSVNELPLDFALEHGALRPAWTRPRPRDRARARQRAPVRSAALAPLVSSTCQGTDRRSRVAGNGACARRGDARAAGGKGASPIPGSS